MPGAELVTRIRIDSMEALQDKEKPVLAACIRDDVDYKGMLDTLETVAVYAGPSVRICVIPEDLLPFFERRYGVKGTPTFLLMQGGELKDSLLGKSSVEGLMEFIMPCIRGSLKSPDSQVAKPGRALKARTMKSPHKPARRRGAR